MADSVNTLIQQADFLMKNGHEDTCLSLYRSLCERAPNDPKLRLKYALALDHFSREEEAIPVYKKALKTGLNPDDERIALICLASSYRNVGQLDAALTTIMQALEKFPDDVVAACFYSLILLDAGWGEKAVQQLGRTLLRTLDPLAFEGFHEALNSKFNELTD